MRRLLGLCALWAVGACNQIYGIDRTRAVPPIDAQFFDAPSDAPFACPTGPEAPAFSPLFHQIVQDCTDYTASETTGRALAMCATEPPGVAEGPADGPLTLIPGLEIVPGTTLSSPRLAPEGDELYVKQYPSMASFGGVTVYRKTGTTWTATGSLAVPDADMISQQISFGTPSRGPTRRMFVMNGDGVAQEIELSDPSQPHLINKYVATDLGLAYLSEAPNLSPDGLRLTLVGSGTQRTLQLYASRTSLTERFPIPVPLPGVPRIDELFMTSDCSRVYFSAASALLWIQRL